MENKQITSDCTLARYRKEYASGHLYRQLNVCMVYGIAAALLLLTAAVPNVSEAVGAQVVAMVSGLNLILVIAAVKSRNKLCAVVLCVLSMLLTGYLLWKIYSWVLYIWEGFRYFGFRWVASNKDWPLFCIFFVSGVLNIACCVKMLGVFKKIDAEYRDLMANLRG